MNELNKEVDKRKNTQGVHYQVDVRVQEVTNIRRMS